MTTHELMTRQAPIHIANSNNYHEPPNTAFSSQSIRPKDRHTCDFPQLCEATTHIQRHCLCLYNIKLCVDELLETYPMHSNKYRGRNTKCHSFGAIQEHYARPCSSMRLQQKAMEYGAYRDPLPIDSCVLPICILMNVHVFLLTRNSSSIHVSV